MLTLDSTIRDMLQHIVSYQPIAAGDFYKPGTWIPYSREEQHHYIYHLGLDGIDLRAKSFMDVGCAEGYACFYAEEQGAEPVIACDGHGWKYGTPAEYPWDGFHPQNEILLFELLKLLKRSKVIRLVEDVESADFADSVARLGRERIDVVLCSGVLYHTLSPLRALRNLLSVTDELLILNITDYRSVQADGRVFTPYPNRPDSNDFDYRVLPYGQTNSRFWNLAPEDWKNMIEYAGFCDVDMELRGPLTVFRCRVPASHPTVRQQIAAREAEIAGLRRLVAAYERGRFIHTMRAVREAWRRVRRRD